MKKNNFIKALHTTLYAVALAALCTACCDFEDYNTHPYNPTMKMLTPTAQVGSLMEKMFYQMHHNQENDSQMIDQMVGDQYGGYISNVEMWRGTNFATYNQSEEWNQIPFNTPFDNFYANWNRINEITDGKGYIFAWTNIIRVAAMLRITDTYGPVPYSKMGKGQFRVAYDSEETVYKSMAKDLEESVNVLEVFAAENKGKELAIAAYDIVFHGNFEKWILFANSLRLRLAIRMSNVAAEYAKTVGEAAVEAGVITANVNNVLLPSTDNPYCKVANNWNEIRLSADMDSYMNGYADPRLPLYATQVSANKYAGVRMGVNVTNGSKATYGNYSKPNFAENSPIMVMNAAEVAFLKAEGALRGWNMGGSAQSFYEEGIRLSMAQYPSITATSINSYINDNVKKPASYTGPDAETSIGAAGNITIKWEDGAMFDIKLERIITQKWIANFMLGFESWSEYRRTGYPKLFPSINNMSGGIIDDARGIRRLKYPSTEYSGNYANVQAAIQMIGGVDSPAVDLWWAKKD